ncbi:MAG: hypothetical protein A3K19_03230 [Lentisphaerae bacterium RIFOXYB12_FULL_65_16]|nr:MAG: hypothetical protein A3K18_32030 [Lentisphaerae bacterium RIFOXYA12_64_32]OGV92189.1 MAG: hypothetical protein A3K19_03230 [Lentisphaerae bacterium RIFOXYB12_FULL_65_16]
MLYHLAPILTDIWGPFRLFGSYLVLIGIGAALASLLTGLILPRVWHLLPQDRGKVHVQKGEVSKGKPTGAGFVFVLLLLPVLFLVLPFSAKYWSIAGCLLLAMLAGYGDDASEKPWGELLKGTLDLLVALATSVFMCEGREIVVWLPLVKGDFTVSPWLYVPCATALLWVAINTTNCSDGVDGLAGVLTLLSLFYLGGFLYIVIGHREMAAYLLVPHNMEGAKWAVLIISASGAMAGYLWHNAEPSRVLMGDAGSRFLGLLVGVAVLASGNPALILVVAPVVLVNGGTGLVKLALLRGFKLMGMDTRTPQKLKEDAQQAGGDTPPPKQFILVRLMHRVRFPLHDHCRKELRWSNPQVLLRFVLLQAFLTPLLLGLLVKVR